MALAVEPANAGVCTFRSNGSIVEIDLENRRARANDRHVHTTQLEFAMVRLLVRNLGRVQPLRALAEATGEEGEEVNPEMATHLLFGVRERFNRSRAGAGNFLCHVKDGWVIQPS